MEKSIGKAARVLVGVERRIEVWRKGKLIDLDIKLIDAKDLVVTAGLDVLCGQGFDVSGSRPAAFNSIAIGTGTNATLATNVTLQTEAMRIAGVYTKTTPGACTVAGTFAIVTTLALVECGLFNHPTAGTMYCRDLYMVKNVVSGDTVNVTYTPSFAAA